MKVGDYKNAKAREIIEDAISQLMALGLDADGAAGLLVVQGTIRIESPEKLQEAADFVTSTINRDFPEAR